MDYTILECRKFVFPYTGASIERTVCNYEFDFNISGGRTIHLDNNEFKVDAGSITFKKPGQQTSSKGDYNNYILTVDFSNTTHVSNYLRNTATQIEPIFDNILINSIPSIFTPMRTKEFQSLFSTLSHQADLNSVASHSLFEEILFLINADLQHKKFANLPPVKNTAYYAKQFIDQNFQENIQLVDIAEHAHINENHLIRIFKKSYGITPVNYIIDCRLRYACHLLTDTNLPTSEIAELSGYNSTTFFITQFKKKFQITPYQYRTQIIYHN